jgi:hypothetical protein
MRVTLLASIVSVASIVNVVSVAMTGACGGAESDASSSSDGSSSETPPACVASVALPDPIAPPATHADCLADTSAFDASWELKDDAWCIVAHYDVPGLTASPMQTLAWGRHGGPLQGDSTITRWSPPPGATGTMTSTVENLPGGASAAWAVDYRSTRGPPLRATAISG